MGCPERRDAGEPVRTFQRPKGPPTAAEGICDCRPGRPGRRAAAGGSDETERPGARRPRRDRTPAVVKMDPRAPTQPVAPAAERPPPRRGLGQPEHPPGVLRSAYLAELHEQGRAPLERVNGGGRGASGPASPASRALPGNERPGSSRTTGGPPVSAAGARRAPSGRRTWPPASPPASGRGVESDEVALEARAARRGDRGAPLHGGEPTSPRRPPATGCW